jgi:hypothetical protein
MEQCHGLLNAERIDEINITSQVNIKDKKTQFN